MARRERLAVVAVVLLSGLALAACGGQAVGTQRPVQGPTVAQAPPATAAPQSGDPLDGAAEGFTTVDVVFLQQMLGHHQVAAQLAEMASSRADAPRVREVAQQMAAETASEDRRMSRWLQVIGIDPSAVLATGGHSHGGGPTPEDLTDLGTRTGAAFDAQFVRLALEHSIGAIDLTRAEAVQGSNSTLKRFAADIARRESDRSVELPTLAG
jgi:uncharacterized protein (DUF305 family)